MMPDSNNTAKQMDVKIPSNFESNKTYLPLAQLNNINGEQLPAIGDYLTPPDSGKNILIYDSSSGNYNWIPGTNSDGFLIYESSTSSLSWFQAPSGNGTYVLGYNGSFTWLQTQDC